MSQKPIHEIAQAILKLRAQTQSALPAKLRAIQRIEAIHRQRQFEKELADAYNGKHLSIHFADAYDR